MSKWTSRKFLVSVLVILSVIAKEVFGVEVADSVVEQVADALMVLITAVAYVFAEAKVDAARAREPQDGADLR